MAHIRTDLETTTGTPEKNPSLPLTQRPTGARRPVRSQNGWASQQFCHTCASPGSFYISRGPVAPHTNYISMPRDGARHRYLRVPRQLPHDSDWATGQVVIVGSWPDLVLFKVLSYPSPHLIISCRLRSPSIIPIVQRRKRRPKGVFMSPWTVIVNAGMSAGPSKLSSSYLSTGTLSPGG